ncbi:MAG TPA: LamG-like jellyroll fold domain-containing protein, partial [Acidimicrobiia bacterium]
NGVTTDSWSVEVWIRCDDVNSASPQIIWEEGGADAGVSLYVQSGDVYGLMWTASTIRKQISASVSSGDAHHIVFVGTNTGNRCDLFIDGTSSASPTVNTATSLVPSVPVNPFLLDDAVRGELDANILGGQDANGIARANGTTRSHTGTVTNDWYFGGQIGDVARYNVGLTSTEVEAHYAAQRYVLAGDLLVDVTEDVRSVDIRRGRSSETTNVDAGSGTVTLDNRERKYDPLASASVTPYAPSILPRKEVVVEMEGRQFTGMVEDWDLQYSPGGDSVTLVKLTDQFTTLNEQTLASGAGATGLSGSVIYQAASAVDWELGRVDLDDGTETVGPHELERATNALQYMQKIANTESALLFIGKGGELTYRDRISPRRVFGTRFADDGSGIPFASIEISYGTEFLYTQVEVSYPSGSVEVTDTFQAASTSIGNYGVRTLSLDTFLSGSGPAEGIGELLVERYGEPELRIEAIEVQLDGLTVAQREELLDLELGDGVEIQFTPNGIGEPIFREMAVDLIQHSVIPGSHVVRLRMFVPVLLRRIGSVSGTSSTAGSVTGSPNLVGSAEGSTNVPVGSVTGAKGAIGSAAGSTNPPAGTVVGAGASGFVTGSSGTAGSVTGTAQTAFVLGTSELDGDDRLAS